MAMEHRAILDNWSLQSVSQLLKTGLPDDDASIITVDVGRQTHGYRSVPDAVIAIEAFFDLVADIVLRDQLWVDSRFTDTWFDSEGPLHALVESEIVFPFHFLAQPEELDAPREEFVRRLCFTESLQRQHAENVKGWRDAKATPNYDQPYTPHPLRRRMFTTANLLISGEDAAGQVTALVEEKQVAWRAFSFGGDKKVSLQVSLPAFASQVIRESSKVSDLIPVALQLRDEYRELREWLNAYQTVLQSGNFEDVRRYENILRSVSKYADGQIGKVGNDAPTFTVGVELLKIAIKNDPVTWGRNQFGVRALINRLIFLPSRHADLQKLLSLFGQRTTTTGLRVTDHFMQRSSSKH